MFTAGWLGTLICQTDSSEQGCVRVGQLFVVDQDPGNGGQGLRSREVSGSHDCVVLSLSACVDGAPGEVGGVAHGARPATLAKAGHAYNHHRHTGSSATVENIISRKKHYLRLLPYK